MFQTTSDFEKMLENALAWDKNSYRFNRGEHDMAPYSVYNRKDEVIVVHNVLGINKEDLKIITCHIGNGASISAVKGGKCIDTSMGLTPLEGIPMGTRSGNIDPAVLEYMNTIDPEKYTGFAFGLGMTRLAMMKYGIKDIRDLNSGKLDSMCQFTDDI